MATPLKPLPKRLSELLQEEQEPFLIENGHSKKLFKPKATCKCWRFNSHGWFRRRKAAGGFRLILTKLVYWKSIKESLNWQKLWLVDCFSVLRGKTNSVGFYGLSSSSFRGEGEMINGGESNVRTSVELSPVSVLELHSDDSHSIEEENPPTSAYGRFSPKLELQQSSHLLLDYLEEMRDKGCWECYGFGGQRIDGNLMGVAKQIELDLSETRREWSHFDAERREVGREIEGIILEEIREECVLDVLGLGFHSTLETR